MAKNYHQLQKEIDSLQKKADAARAKELKGVIAEIKSVIAQWGVTAEDLGLSTSKSPSVVEKAATKRGGRSAKAKKGAASAAKYRDEQGNSWGGQGPRPAWLRAAIDAGRSLDEFLA